MPPTDVPSITKVSFEELMTLEPHGPDTFVGIAPRYPWGRIFGGQVVAQALRAAQHTVDSDYSVHSLHAYFIRGGTSAEPVRFEVDRIRNGRSFLTRRVVARQSNGAILNLSASFQVAEEAPDVAAVEPPTDLATPDELRDEGWGRMLGRRRARREFGRESMWLRLLEDLPNDPELLACGFAFVSDAAPTGAVRATHPRQFPTREESAKHFVGASLDHSIYFQRPVDPTKWILVDTTCTGMVNNRGLSIGNVFDAEGHAVANIVQEVLLRERRPS
ncbi:MAG: acyl-CoA thioesterase [Acidimicrobiales bacterium]